MQLPVLNSCLLRQYTDTALSEGKDLLGDAVHNKVRIAPDRRSEVGVAGRGQGEMALVVFAVARLAQGTEHEVGQDALLRLAGDLESKLLIHARGDGYIFCDLVLARLVTVARCAAS